MDKTKGKHYVEIDASPWMHSEGITVSLFLGDASESCYEEEFTYEDLIQKELETHSVCGKIFLNYAEEAEEFILKLEDAAKYARALFTKMKET